MNLDNDTTTGLLDTITDQKNQLKIHENRVSDLNSDLENISRLLDDCLGAMQGYQKAGGADRADWDFSDEIKQIEEFLNE